MFLWGPDVTAGSAGGIGIFYVMALGHYDYVPLAEVLEELRSKREMLHVVITRRNAKEELVDLADLVTEMRLIKHPYKAGIKAQRGVEF